MPNCYMYFSNFHEKFKLVLTSKDYLKLVSKLVDLTMIILGKDIFVDFGFEDIEKCTSSFGFCSPH